HNGDRFFRARSIALLRRTRAWLSASHEFDNAFPVLAAVFLAEFFLKDWQYRPVELLRLGDAHAVHLKTDDGQARPGKHFDYAAGPQIWEFEVVGLDQDECLFDLRVRGEADRFPSRPCPRSASPIPRSEQTCVPRRDRVPCGKSTGQRCRRCAICASSTA